MSRGLLPGALLAALLALLAPVAGRHEPMPREPWTRFWWSPHWFDHGGGYMQIHGNYYTQYRIMASIRMLVMNMHGFCEDLIQKMDYIQEWTFLDNSTIIVDRILSIQKYYQRIVNLFLKAAKALPYHVTTFDWMYKQMIHARRMYMELDNQIQIVVEDEMFDPGGWRYGRRAGGGPAGRRAGGGPAARRRQQRYYTGEHARGQRQFW